MSRRSEPSRSTRRIALDALVEIEQGGHANVVLPEMLGAAGLEARDRAWVTHHTYGTVRWQRRLDDLLGGSSDRPVETVEPRVRAALRLGAHQLVDGVAAHAAVAETVAAAPRRARPYVNAVLRRIAGTGPPWPEPADEAIATSHPDWIVERLRSTFGAARASEVLAVDNAPPPVTLRVRPGVDVDAVAAELVATGARVERGDVAPRALVVRSGGAPGAWPAVRSGRATVQDQASQAVVEVLDPQPAELVLDLAAAPGGKTGAIAERIGEAGFVVAVDHDAERVARIGATAARLSLGNVATVVADARQLPLGAMFERVLLDAPCSGLGVLRRRADARWRIRAADVAGLAEQQRTMLAEASTRVRVGGTLVYSVCTWTSEETVEVARWASAALRGFVPVGIAAPWREHGGGGLLLPADGHDGMFVAAWTRGATGSRIAAGGHS